MPADESATRVKVSDPLGLTPQHRLYGRRATETGATVSDPEGLRPTLARLMIWLSPAYPVGGFSYSHGLEWTVEAGKVHDAATLGDWVEDILRHGAGRSDAILLAEAWRAVTDGDERRLDETVDLAAAF